MFSCFQSLRLQPLSTDAKLDPYTVPRDAPPQYSPIAFPSGSVSGGMTTKSPLFQAETSQAWSLIQVCAGTTVAPSAWTIVPVAERDSYVFKIERNADRVKNLHVTFTASEQMALSQSTSPELFITSIQYAIKAEGGKYEDKEYKMIDWNGATLLAHNASENKQSHADASKATFCVSVLPFNGHEHYIPLGGLMDLDLLVSIKFRCQVTEVQLIVDGMIDGSSECAQVLKTAFTRYRSDDVYHVWKSLNNQYPSHWCASQTFNPTGPMQNTLECNLLGFGRNECGHQWIEWFLIYSPRRVDKLTLSTKAAIQASLQLSGTYSAMVAFEQAFGRRNPLPEHLYFIGLEGGLREQRLESLTLVVETGDSIVEPVTVYGKIRGGALPTTVCFTLKNKSV